MSVIQQIQKAVRDGKYVFTEHCKEEAEADGLWLSDVVNVLLMGELDSTYEDDPRGTRYVVRGDIEEVEVDVVCRFGSDGKLLIIITTYVVDE